MFSEVPPATATNSVSVSVSVNDFQCQDFQEKIWLILKDVAILSVTGNQEGVCVDNSSS